MKQAKTVKIHGQDYEPVASRVERFRESYPSYGVVTKIISNGDQIVMKAAIKDENERVISTGYAEEERGKGNINESSALENCETSAIGRALAAFGYTGGEYASADEVANAVGAQSKETNGDDSTINFGKHKGTKWSELPDDYLNWLAENGRQENVKERANRELENRLDDNVDLSEEPFK